MIHFVVGKSLEFKLLTLEDSSLLFALVDENREHLGRWLPWVDQTIAVEQCKEFIEAGLRQLSENGSFHAGIWSDGNLCGVIGLHPIDWANRSVSIGYWLAKGHQGQGIVSRCCRVLLRFLFEECALERVEIRCAAANLKSCSIAERLGFKLEGVLRSAQRVRQKMLDLKVYSLLRSEWTSFQDGTQD